MFYLRYIYSPVSKIKCSTTTLVMLIKPRVLSDDLFTTTTLFQLVQTFITIHKLRMKQETKLFLEILVPFLFVVLFSISGCYIIKLSRHCIGLQLHPDGFIFQLICLICFSSVWFAFLLFDLLFLLTPFSYVSIELPAILFGFFHPSVWTWTWKKQAAVFG